MSTAAQPNAFIVIAILAAPALYGQVIELPVPVSAETAAAKELLARGDTFEAIRVLRALQRTAPQSAETQLWLGVAYYLAGQHKLFVREMSAAEKGLPRDPFPSYALGRHRLDNEGRMDLARQAFQESLRRSPSHTPAAYHLGWCFELDRKYSEALALYERASGYWLAHVGLARLAMSEDRYDEARRQADRAISLRPDSAMAHLLKARAVERGGDPKSAIGSYRSAAGLDPTDASIWYQLSRCARVAGDASTAAEALARFREVAALYGSN